MFCLKDLSICLNLANFVETSAEKMSELLSNNAIVKKFTAFLESGNHRKTPERFAILNQALLIARPFTAEHLCDVLKMEDIRVSRSTVYNNIDLFCQAGIFRRFYNEGIQEMQYLRVGNTNYVHLVCLACGKVKEVKDSLLAAELNAKKYAAFNDSYYTLCVYGTCSTCARKAKKNQKIKK